MNMAVRRLRPERFYACSYVILDLTASSLKVQNHRPTHVKIEQVHSTVNEVRKSVHYSWRRSNHLSPHGILIVTGRIWSQQAITLSSHPCLPEIYFLTRLTKKKDKKTRQTHCVPKHMFKTNLPSSGQKILKVLGEAVIALSGSSQNWLWQNWGIKKKS